MTAPIRVLIVDDDAMVRSGLTMMLSGAPQIEVVGEASDGRGVLPAVDLHNPDVVLMDIRMPRLDGIAATRLLSAQPHPPAVLVLTTFDADELVLRALQAGAAGFLLKDSPPADIVRAIDSVHAGDGMLSPRITRRLIDLVAGDPDAATSRERARQRLAALTPREREVAAAVADGSSNAEIATRLHMSLATVKAHVSRLLVKLDAANRVQIALLVQDAASRPRLFITPDQPRRNVNRPGESGDSGCCLAGLDEGGVLTVVGGLQFGWRNVAAGFVEPAVVEPVDVFVGHHSRVCADFLYVFSHGRPIKLVAGQTSAGCYSGVQLRGSWYSAGANGGRD